MIGFVFITWLGIAIVIITSKPATECIPAYDTQKLTCNNPSHVSSKEISTFCVH